MASKRRKNESADLESTRLTAFLLGLIVVLAGCFVALEYNGSRSDAHADDEDLLRELMAEGDAMPIMMHTETFVLPEQQAENNAAEHIKIVDEESYPNNEETADDDELAADTLLAAIDSMAFDSEAMAPPPPVDVADDDKPLDFRVVQDVPQFPGGHGEFVKWLTKNLRYPPTPERLKVQGKVAVTFIVERDGTISNIEVAQPLYSDLNDEALRVMRMMPPWLPGKYNGELCRTMVCVPIVFKL